MDRGGAAEPVRAPRGADVARLGLANPSKPSDHVSTVLKAGVTVYDFVSDSRLYRARVNIMKGVIELQDTF